ncbi:carbohydrate-binding protein [Escherichia coli]|uniref:gp53-like domain-containing protein n=1 Tax=Escherichia coli TaxID=562 RepID=UPI000DE23BE1|nr:carbohydrate-binding protein [Escherichia coli]HAV7786192.1 carbohydrate-binding protein [Escherichia coli]
MSKIVRYQGDVRAFASDAQGMERTVFGGTNQADDLTSQITASFLRGWGIVGASEHPSLEDFNAAMYAMSQFIAYQHQMGVPEWHAEQEYHIGSICTHNGESYQSLQNANIGSQPPSAKWTPVLTSKNGLANLGLGELALAGATTGAMLVNGYVAIPLIISGVRRPLIIQWGVGQFGGSLGDDAGYLNNFPFAFPSACYVMVASHVGHTPSGAGILSASAITKSGFRGFSSVATAANPVSGCYVAIGG